MSKWKRVKSLPRRWQRNQLINKYGCVCYLCGDPIETMKEITFDHWVPVSQGGTDTLDNYRLAHDECNVFKADMSPETFRLFQEGTLALDSTPSIQQKAS